jgi:hypothetical protein
VQDVDALGHITSAIIYGLSRIHRFPDPEAGLSGVRYRVLVGKPNDATRSREQHGRSDLEVTRAGRRVDALWSPFPYWSLIVAALKEADVNRSIPAQLERT